MGSPSDRCSAARIVLNIQRSGVPQFRGEETYGERTYAGHFRDAV
jgi:hypothetical protein